MTEPTTEHARGREAPRTPRPPLPWLMSQRWRDVAFLHWPISVAALRPHVPPMLAIDLFEGEAWIGLTPFVVESSRLRGLVPMAGARTFPETNLRTYVRIGERRGVLFFSLDAGSALAVLGARALFQLPYRAARMRVTRDDEWIEYRSRRLREEAELVAHVRPEGEPFEPAAGSIEHFLVERYALFTVTRAGRVLEGDIQHSPWRLSRCEARIERNTIASAAGLVLEGPPALAHLGEPQDVRIWPPRRARWGPLPS